MSAIIVVRASESLREEPGIFWGIMSLRACRPTTEKTSLSSGAAIDCNLTYVRKRPKVVTCITTIQGDFD